MHLAAKHESCAKGAIGEALYLKTLLILRNRGNYSMGRKINSRERVEIECGFPLRDNGEKRKTISTTSWWLYMGEAFLPHVLVSPFGIWGILMERSRDELNP